MKLLMLADPASTHTIKWANSLIESGVDVYLFGFSVYKRNLYNPKIKIYSLNISLSIKNLSEGSASKIIYLLAIKKLKSIIKDFKPDILHAHYAASFGFIGSLIDFHPLITSVWGSDINVFPRKSFIHKKIVTYALKHSDRILSTSKALAEQTKKMINKEIEITPFGVDTNIFKPGKKASIFNSEDIVIGTIKTLESNYGIEYLIKAFKKIKTITSGLSLKMLIVGSGSKESYLRNMVKNLDIENDTIFTGFIEPCEVPKYHNAIDIFVALSIQESFGVSVLEASSCGKPVIVTNVGGMPEVVQNDLTGIIVDKKNIEQTVEAISKLISNKGLREKIGNAGRDWVINNYSWKNSVNQMISIYNGLLKSNIHN